MDWQVAPTPDGFDDTVLPRAVSERIRRFDPHKVPGEVWGEIGPLVRAAVAHASPRTTHEATMLSSRCAALLAWCHERGVPLVPEVVFHPDTIDEFVAVGCAHLASGSRANYRSLLHRVGAHYVGAPTYAPRALPISGSERIAPYTAGEVAGLVGWARGLPTDAMRDGTMTLLGLGLGAGLAAAEINTLTADRVEQRPDDATVIAVPGDRPRHVAVDARWEATVAASAARACGLVFRPERNRVHVNHISRFVERLPTWDGPKLRMQRLRNTWIVDRLSARIPLDALAAAAGVEPAQLALYAQFMAPTPEDELLRLLRGAP